MPGLGSLEFVVIDTTDPERLASFWMAVLGSEITERVDDDYLLLGTPPSGGPALAFQRVPEARLEKNRIHLDLVVADTEQATSKIEAWGGSQLSAERESAGHHWRVMLDPDGNQFCIGS